MQQAEALWQTLQGRLDEMETTVPFNVVGLSSRIELTKKCLSALNQLVLIQQFSGSENEIQYFKNTQPNVFGRLIYYLRLARIESSVPKGSESLRTSAYEKESQRILHYLEQQKEYYRYYRQHLTYLDHIYFIRSADNEQFIAESCPLLDWRLSTMMSQQFARFKAYEMLLDYLSSARHEGNTASSGMNWSAQKVQLAELIYALDSIKAFGNVKTTFIADMICKQWNVHLSFIHKTFEEIRLRKKSTRTPFLDLLKASLLQRMEQDDDK